MTFLKASEQSNIKVPGHKGTWYVISSQEINDRTYYIVEHETYGEDASHLIIGIVNGEVKVIAEDVEDWDDLPNKYELEVFHGKELPANSNPGGYPILYEMDNGAHFCATCATRDVEDVAHHDIYWEGTPIECDGGCGTFIESAYGDPDEDE